MSTEKTSTPQTTIPNTTEHSASVTSAAPRGIIARIAKSNFIQEFKEFINRGSVVDLAIGVAVGGAFTAIVKSLVDDIIMPISSLLAGGLDFSSLALDVPNLFGADSVAHIAYGNFLQNVINFLLVALVIFVIVRAMNKLNRAKDVEAARIAEEKAKSDAKAEAKHIVDTAKAQAKANIKAEEAAAAAKSKSK